jgi:integrase
VEVFELSAFTPIDGHPGFYRRREGGPVYFRYRDRRRKQVWVSARTIRQAEREKIRLEDEVERGVHRAPSRERFADYAHDWIETYQGRTSRGIQEHTREEYRRLLERDAIPFFGQMRLSEIGPRDVKRFVAEVGERIGERSGKPVSPDTVRLAVQPVKALLATAYEEELIPSNPAQGLRLNVSRSRPADAAGGEVIEDDEKVKALSAAELAALLAAIPEEWRLFHRFLAQTGLRFGEAVELRWRDVDLGQRTVRVRRRFNPRARPQVGPPKSSYSKRTVRLSPDLARALWVHRGETHAGDDDLVFTAGGRRIDASNLMSRVLKPAAVEAGLGEWVREEGKRPRAESWVGFHTFRHTCATLLFKEGWNAKQVQRWLGHHRASFTLDTYVHLLPDDVPEPLFFDRLPAAGRPAARGDALPSPGSSGRRSPERPLEATSGQG